MLETLIELGLWGAGARGGLVNMGRTFLICRLLYSNRKSLKGFEQDRDTIRFV